MNDTRKYDSKTLPEVERTYTCQQVAAILGLSYETIIALCESELLGYRDIGPRSESYSLRVITQSQLDDFIERTSVPVNDPKAIAK